MLRADDGRESIVDSRRTAYGVQRTAYSCFIALLLLGTLQALWYRRTLNPDGVAYLDLSDEVLAGRWGELVQAYWSPLYPVLLAAARAIAGQGALHEAAIAHAVTFAGFAFALGGWHLVLRQLARRGIGLVDFGTPLGVAAGYAVFAWAMLRLASLHFVTPDLWLSGWIFVVSAFMLQHADGASARLSFALGAALGAGYLTKSVLFPVAPFFIAGAVLLSRVHRRRVAVLACVAFAALAGPWVAAISVHEGRLTFGDNGRFNHAWFVTGDRWLSPDPQRETGPGAAVFPRVVFTPATYTWPDGEGTYAPWRDPSRWHGAMQGRFDAVRQGRVLAKSWNIYSFYLAPWGVLLTVLIVAGAKVVREQARVALAIAGPSIIGLAGYALVFVEGRYVAPFLALVLVGVPFALRPPATNSVRRVALAVVLGIVLWMALGIRIPATIEVACGLALYLVLMWRGARPAALATVAGVAMVTLGGAHVLFRSATDGARVLSGRAMVDSALEVRARLLGDVFSEGQRIAVIGDGPRAAVWAREVRARIVAEVPASQAASYWSGSAERRAVAERAMRDAGAAGIVAVDALPDTLPPGWYRIPGNRVARYVFGVP